MVLPFTVLRQLDCVLAKVVAVPVTTTGEFQHDAPVPLVDSPQTLIRSHARWTLPMFAGTPPGAITELNLIVNWFDDLRRRLGAPSSSR